MTSEASRIEFHKMHGAGNDFVLLDFRKQGMAVDAALASRLADRRLGVGCDQVLVLRPAEHADHTARYEILNADGSFAGQCGNGARCIALFLELNSDSPSGPLALESPSGIVHVERCEDGEYEVALGTPGFEPDQVPIDGTPDNGRYRLDTPWGEVSFTAASMGNPHALIEVKDVGRAPLDTIGRHLSRHAVFPQGCNVEFAEIADRGTLRLRVYERGVGETLACGSGACAAVAMLHREGRVDAAVDVFLPGGHLVIKWPGPGLPVRMKGPAAYVFRGRMKHE